MGQREVYELLKELRLEGDAFYTRSDVELKLREKGFSNGVLHSLTKDLGKIEGYLDIHFNWSGKVLDWKKEFRLKKKYVK